MPKSQSSEGREGDDADRGGLSTSADGRAAERGVTGWPNPDSKLWR